MAIEAADLMRCEGGLALRRRRALRRRGQHGQIPRRRGVLERGQRVRSTPTAASASPRSTTSSASSARPASTRSRRSPTTSSWPTSASTCWACRGATDTHERLRSPATGDRPARPHRRPTSAAATARSCASSRGRRRRARRRHRRHARPGNDPDGRYLTGGAQDLPLRTSPSTSRPARSLHHVPDPHSAFPELQRVVRERGLHRRAPAPRAPSSSSCAPSTTRPPCERRRTRIQAAKGFEPRAHARVRDHLRDDRLPGSSRTASCRRPDPRRALRGLEPQLREAFSPGTYTIPVRAGYSPTAQLISDLNESDPIY